MSWPRRTSRRHPIYSIWGNRNEAIGPSVGSRTGAVCSDEPRGGSDSRKWVECPRAASLPLPRDARAALRPDRRVAGGPVRQRRDHASHRRARDGHRGATAAEGSRRLRHQRRAPAGQAGRHATARLRRRSSPTGSGPRTASPGWRSPDPASSTSASTPAPRVPSPTTSSRRERRTAAPRRAASRRSTSSSSPRTRPVPSRSRAPGGPPWATRWPACSRRAATRSPASTTSTTMARRSTGSAGRSSPAHATSRPPRTATPGSTSPTPRRPSSPTTPRLRACPTTRRWKPSVSTAST